MYACKECGQPVELAIEGELICEDCWSMGQWSEEEWAFYREMLWFKTHCARCEETFPSAIIEQYSGLCKSCYDAMQKSLEKLKLL